MTGSRRMFTVTAPDWGHTHLTTDAVVAFVDDELAHGPHARAVQHVAACPECAGEVVAQRQARTALRGAAGPVLPSSLLSSLRSIPQDADLPDPPAGLAVAADGTLVSVVRGEQAPAGLPAAADCAAEPGPRRSTRRLRLGAGAAMSGLALGALALGVSAVPADTTPRPDPDRGVLGGSVLGTGATPARFGLDGSAGPGTDARPTALRARTFLRHGPR